MPRKRSSTFVGMGSVGGLLLVGLVGGPVASAEELPESPAGVDGMLQQVVDDTMIETMTALEDAGAIGPNSQFADLYLGSELVDPGTLVIRYNAKSPKAEEFAKNVTDASKSAPLKLELAGVNLDPGALRLLAADISAGGDQWLQALGVRDIQAVEINELTGELTVQTSGEASRAKLAVEGVMIAIDGGATVDFQSRTVDSKPVSTRD